MVSESNLLPLSPLVYVIKYLGIPEHYLIAKINKYQEHCSPDGLGEGCERGISREREGSGPGTTWGGLSLLLMAVMGTSNNTGLIISLVSALRVVFRGFSGQQIPALLFHLCTCLASTRPSPCCLPGRASVCSQH